MAGLGQHLASLDDVIRRLEQIIEKQLELARVNPLTASTYKPESPSQRAMPRQAVTPTRILPAGLREEEQTLPSSWGFTGGGSR